MLQCQTLCLQTFTKEQALTLAAEKELTLFSAKQAKFELESVSQQGVFKHLLVVCAVKT